MSRIVYFSIARTPTGGQKVAFRHVEELCRVGLPAAVCCPPDANTTWFRHNAPVVGIHEINGRDIVVIGEDALPGLAHFRRVGCRTIIFCQNHFFAGSHGVGTLPLQEREGLREFIACSASTAAWVGRAFPRASVALLPAFADERVFKPGSKRCLIAYTPRKLPKHAEFIRNTFARVSSLAQEVAWAALDRASEAEVAATFSEAAVFLSLNHLEGLGITTLEAMASGCIPVGFTGIGGDEYARPENGFWVAENDCEAAADALIEAVHLVVEGGRPLEQKRAAAQRTASDWSHARAMERVCQFWSRARG